MEEPESQGVYCEVIFPSNVVNYTSKVSPTWLPKHEMNKDDANGHTNWMGKSLQKPQSYPKDY